jgi:Cysteine rich repeat
MKTGMLIATLGAALLLGSAAQAATSALEQVCAKDIKAFCADVKPGGGKLSRCVKSHFKDLSADCQVTLVRQAAVGRACKADIKKLCSDAKSGGAAASCLTARAADLSSDCKDAMSKAQAADK